jgi:hypothetical protein
LGRGYWTPDEPREADIAWRMSWQSEKAVPLLAGEAFCEKPPLNYWLAAVPIRLFGMEAWAARLPNLLYALITALGVGLLARRSAGRFAGLVGAAAISTFLLSYQVAIWLATDAPLLATVSVALLGAYIGFYATVSRERLRGYLLMHAALGLGFLCKSAAAWMVPAMAIMTLVIWEKRWRELLRWELYVGLLLQAAMILPWVWFVYVGPDGAAHLKVFFWNNLVGRFTHVDAPTELQYAMAHRNSPGKYLIESSVYLFPWTLLVVAAARRAWAARKSSFDGCDRAQCLFGPRATGRRSAARLVGAGNSIDTRPLGPACVARNRGIIVALSHRVCRGGGANRCRRLEHYDYSFEFRHDFCDRLDFRRMARAARVGGGAQLPAASTVVFIAGLLRTIGGPGIADISTSGYLAGSGDDRSRHSARRSGQALDPIRTG